MKCAIDNYTDHASSLPKLPSLHVLNLTGWGVAPKNSSVNQAPTVIVERFEPARTGRG